MKTPSFDVEKGEQRPPAEHRQIKNRHAIPPWKNVIPALSAVKQKGRTMRVDRPVQGTGRPEGLPHGRPIQEAHDTDKKTAIKTAAYPPWKRAVNPDCRVSPATYSPYPIP
ncbi:hypothetical protein [uncultured Desulfobacter sp.]|uniref:hypothetical protein n=1 Tax=uncultured Desulfobacter sp. TaxID=240139 RepID=UPI0029F5A305|nr:hypothetical protein [uncultured Desulfobacter sp.]